MKLCCLLITIMSGTSLGAPEKVSFTAKDGLEVSGDLYAPHKEKETPFIVLFHQARSSRGEYAEIAPRLNKLGFNCLAVDQRSGGDFAKTFTNETHARAVAKGLPTTYDDAYPDLE